METLFVYDDIFLKHNTGSHPENSKRLESINSAIQQVDLRLKFLEPIKAEDRYIRLIHSEKYIEHVHNTIKSGEHFLDSYDTAISFNSLSLPISKLIL